MIGPKVHPVSGTTAYFRSSATAALGTIVSPASNTKGIRITFVAASGYDRQTRIMAKTSAPSSWSDSGALTLAVAYALSSSGQSWVVGSAPITLPPGFGLYEQASDAVSLSGAAVNYEVL